MKEISLMKLQCVINCTTCQTEIPTLQDTWIKKTHLLSKCCDNKKLLLPRFCDNITCLSVGLLRICQVFSVSCKIVYWWITTNCCFMNDIVMTLNTVFCRQVVGGWWNRLTDSVMQCWCIMFYYQIINSSIFEVHCDLR